MDLKYNRGFSLIEMLVGIGILLMVMLSLFGLFQLGLKVVGQSRARIMATALANQKIEELRNLSYSQVGTIGGIPSGSIPETEIITRNNTDYTVKTTVGYIDDSFDGTAPDDSLPNDYKRAKTKVSWQGFLGGEVVLVTDIAPKGLEASEGGGNLLISVFDALGAPIPQADIHIINTAVNPPIDVSYFTNDEGQYLVAGAPTSTAAYEITITKPSYSTDRTYSIVEVANPEKPHITVLESQLTQVSFSIDRLSSFSIDTFSPWGSDSFSDSFLDQTKISEFLDIVVSGGKAELATTTEGYKDSGYLLSSVVSPENFVIWNSFSWSDNQSAETQIKYQVFYFTDPQWQIIPEVDLPGNSIGFSSSPVDLSGLATTTYPQLKVEANLSTSSTNTSPFLFDWSIIWTTEIPTPIGNVSFNLQGNKIIGTDIDENPVYKYSDDFITDSAGHLDVSNLEWDAYDFTIDPLENLDLVETNPASDPLGRDIDLFPNTNQPVSLFLEAENSLLLNIRNSEILEPIFSAQVRLFNIGLGYDQTQFTNEQGQTFFIPLEIETYQIEVQVDGYENYSGNINIGGDEIMNINLTPIGPS